MQNAPMKPHFMPGGAGDLKKMTEDETTKSEHKMSDHITKMDEELRDRFKALKIIQDDVHKFEEEEQEEIRKLEIEYEEKYKEIYALRNLVVNGKSELDPALIKEFDQRVIDMKDDDYEKVEVMPCDVKSI